MQGAGDVQEDGRRNCALVAYRNGFNRTPGFPRERVNGAISKLEHDTDARTAAGIGARRQMLLSEMGRLRNEHKKPRIEGSPVDTERMGSDGEEDEGIQSSSSCSTDARSARMMQLHFGGQWPNRRPPLANEETLREVVNGAPDLAEYKSLESRKRSRETHKARP